MNQRMDKLAKAMKVLRLQAFLVNKPENIRYLSGFTGGSDASLLITSRGKFIFTDPRYFQQVQTECPGWQLVGEKPGGHDRLAEQCIGYENIGFESHAITHQYYAELETLFKGRLIGYTDVVEKLRLVKDESELVKLREAGRIGDEVFTAVCSFVSAGMTEKEVASEIDYLLRRKGCEKESFDTIAVAGPNAALPHGRPGNRRLRSGDMLTLDFGGFFEGYAGDMTRTIVLRKATAKLHTRYDLLLQAQNKALSMVRAGISCREIDQAVRDHLKNYDLDSYFIHSTGHGVGLEIHELPRVSVYSDSILAENMVITIEPGIYFPDWGGIRIEDMVIVKDGGCEIITRSDKNLIII
ncbi:MAG: M24 family metallopeptidase [Deltaproteobacteria bacterium]